MTDKSLGDDVATVLQLTARGFDLIEKVVTTIRNAVRNRDPKRLDAIEASLTASHVEADVKDAIAAARERLGED